MIHTAGQDFQQVIVKGRLGADPEIRYTQSKMAIANFSVAVGESWKDKNSGQAMEHTEWFRCSAYGNTVEKFIEPYIKKGSAVMVVGKMRTRKWQDQSGNDRYSTDLQVRDIMFQDGTPKEGGGGGQQRGGRRQQNMDYDDRGQRETTPSGGSGGLRKDFDDSIPF